MDTNNIALVLEALGEKLAAMKSTISCVEYSNTKLTEENEKLKKAYDDLMRKYEVMKCNYDGLTDRLNEYIARGQG